MIQTIDSVTTVKSARKNDTASLCLTADISQGKNIFRIQQISGGQVGQTPDEKEIIELPKIDIEFFTTESIDS